MGASDHILRGNLHPAMEPECNYVRREYGGLFLFVPDCACQPDSTYGDGALRRRL